MQSPSPGAALNLGSAVPPLRSTILARSLARVTADRTKRRLPAPAFLTAPPLRAFLSPGSHPLPHRHPPSPFTNQLRSAFSNFSGSCPCLPRCRLPSPIWSSTHSFSSVLACLTCHQSSPHILRSDSSSCWSSADMQPPPAHQSPSTSLLLLVACVPDRSRHASSR